MIHNIFECYFFQPNLTNGTLKERQGDPPYLRRVEHGTRIFVFVR